MAGRQPTTASQAPSTSESRSYFFSQRARRQLGLFFAGASFFAVASVITRRSLVRRYRATVPKFFQPSNLANVEVNGAMEAFDALNIATINVVSAGLMLGGGMLYALDISSLDEMRRKVRATIRADGLRADQDEEEKMIEEWIAKTLNIQLKEEKREDSPKDAERVASLLELISKLEEEKRGRRPSDKERK